MNAETNMVVVLMNEIRHDEMLFCQHCKKQLNILFGESVHERGIYEDRCRQEAYDGHKQSLANMVEEDAHESI